MRCYHILDTAQVTTLKLMIKIARFDFENCSKISR